MAYWWKMLSALSHKNSFKEHVRDAQRYAYPRRPQESQPAVMEPMEPRMLFSASFTGHVFNDINANGLYEPALGEAGISNLPVDLSGDLLFGDQDTATTDAGGQYVLDNNGSSPHAYQGTYFTVSPDITSLSGAAYFTNPSSGQFTYEGDSAQSGVDFGVYAPGLIPGLVLLPSLTTLDEGAVSSSSPAATISGLASASASSVSDFTLSGTEAASFEIVDSGADYELRLKTGQTIEFDTHPVLNVTVELSDAMGVPHAASFSLPVTPVYANPVSTTTVSQGLQDAIRENLGFVASDRPLQTEDLASVTELYFDPTQTSDLTGLAQLSNLEKLVIAPEVFGEVAAIPVLAIEDVTALSNLTHVQIQGASLGDTGPAGLSGLIENLPDTVQTLDLLYNEITTLPTNLLAELPNLQELRLHGNPIAAPGGALSDADGSNNPLEALKGSLVQLDIVSADPGLAVYADDPVADLARRLFYLPTRMFEWVRNHVELDIYHGFMRGAQAVLETRSGNDFDTAILLKELLESSGSVYGTDLHLRYSEVTAPRGQVEAWLGVNNTAAAVEVLELMSPSGSTPVLTDDAVRFAHAYLEWTPSSGGATLILDPSWKFKDRAAQPHELLANLHQDHEDNLEGELKFEEHDLNPGDDADGDGQNGNDGFLDRERPVDASEFYADQVRRHLATNYTDTTVAEVVYDGPIIPVAVNDLELVQRDWQYDGGVDVENATDTSSSDANTIIDSYLGSGSDIWTDLNSSPAVLDPVSLTHSIAIKLANSSYTPPNDINDVVADNFHFIPISEFTAHSWVVKSKLEGASNVVKLYKDGVAYTDVAALTLGPVQTEYRLVAKTYTPSEYSFDLFNNTPNLNIERNIDQLVAIGADAGQESVYSVARKRADYSEAVTRRLEYAFDATDVNAILNLSQQTPSEDEDLTIIGGLADLVQAEYQRRTRAAESKLTGLFGFVDNITFVGLGTVTADIGDGYQENETLQSRILPKQIWVDQPALTSVAEIIGVTETYVRDSLFGSQNNTSLLSGYRRAMGWISSGFEHEVIEDVTNTRSGSTVKAIQIVNAAQGENAIEVTSVAEANALGTFPTTGILPIEAQYNAVVGQIQAGFTSGSLISAIIPSTVIALEDGSGSWFGYFLDRGAGKEFKIASDSISDVINGGIGVDVARPDSTNRVELRNNQSVSIGDPVNPTDGHVYHTETDVVIPNRGVPIEFGRTYKSNQVDADPDTADPEKLYYDSNRGLGAGWSFSYSDRLEFVGPTSASVAGRIEYPVDTGTDPNPVLDTADSIIWYTGDGSRHLFKLSDAGLVTNKARHFESQTTFGRLAELHVSDTDTTVAGYRFVDPSGMNYRFDAKGRLIEITDNFGDGVEVAYGTNDQIEYVQDIRAVGTDRRLAFDWSNGNLELADHTGREWFFTVEDPGGLGYQALTQAEARGDTGQDADDLTAKYTYYAGGILNGLLDKVTKGLKGVGGADTSDESVTQYEYYANRRAMRVTLPDGRKEHFWYRYGLYGTADESGLGEEGNDRAVTYGRDFAGAVTTFVDGGGDVVRYSIADSGEILRETFSDGTTTQAEWNDRGQQLAVYDTYGQIETFDYDDNLDRTATTGVYTQTLGEIGAGTFVSGVMLEQTDREDRKMTYRYGAFTDPTVTHSSVGDYDQLIYNPTTGGQFHLMPLIQVRDEGDPSLSDTRVVATYDHDYWYGQSSVFGYQDAPFGSGVRAAGDGNDDFQFRLRAQIDAEGNITEYAYEQPTGTAADSADGLQSLPIGVTLPHSAPAIGETAGSQASETRLAYNAASQVIAEERFDPANPSLTLVTLYGYDDAGRLIAQMNPNEVAEVDALPTDDLSFGDSILDVSLQPAFPEYSTSFVYDTHGRLETTTGVDPDELGLNLPAPFTKLIYDGRGNVIESHQYDDGGATAANVGDLVTETVYDDQDRAVLMTYANGTQTRMTYDGVGRLQTQTDELGRTTRFVYDGRGRLFATVRPDGSVTRQRVDGGGRVVATTDANGNTTKLYYDELGRLVKQVDPDPQGGTSSEEVRSTHWTYDAHGNLESVEDQRGNKTGYRYDDLDRITHLDDALGQTVTTEYDARGNAIKVTDARGHTTESFYDFADRLIETTTPDPGTGASALTTEFVYDANGNLTHTVLDPDSAAVVADGQMFDTASGLANLSERASVTVNDYDRLNRLIEVTQPDPDGSGALAAPVSELGFDGLGRLITRTDPNGNVTTSAYDELGRLIRETTADPAGPAGALPASTSEVVYDAVGQAVATRDALGHVTRTEYDLAGRVIRESSPDPDGPGPQAASAATYTYDAADNLVSSTDARGNTTTYQYDVQNRLINTFLPTSDTPGAITASVVAAHDTYVRGGQHSAQNYNSDDHFIVKNDITDDTTGTEDVDRIGIVQFDDIPASVVSALDEAQHRRIDSQITLDLHLLDVNDISGSPTYSEQLVYLYDPTIITNHADWFESVHWDSLTGSSTEYPELDTLGVLLGSVAVEKDQTGTVSIDLGASSPEAKQALIRRIIDSEPITLLIGSPQQENRVYVKYASSDSATESHRPRLSITVPETGPVQSIRYDAAGNMIATTDELGRTWLYGYDELNRNVRETAPADESGIGVYYEFYGINLGGNLNLIEDLSYSPTLTGTYEYQTHGPPLEFLVFDDDNEYHAFRFFSILEINNAGEYYFTTVSDDGVQLSINNHVLIDAGGITNQNVTHGDSIWLDAGQHFINLNYVQHVNPALLEFWYDGPDTGYLEDASTPYSFANSSTKQQVGYGTDIQTVPGPSTNKKYDENGNLTKTIDPNGNETLYFYDTLNGLVRTVNAEVADSGIVVNNQGTNADGYTIETIYDDRGRAVLTIDELGREYGTVYDNLDRVIYTIEPDPETGKAFDSVIDAREGIVPMSAGPRLTEYRYDAAGNVVSIVDPLGRATYTQYDALNRPTHTLNPAAEASGLTIDGDGDGAIDNALSPHNTDATVAPYLAETVYDELGRVVLVVDELGREFGTVYDGLGRVSVQVDPHPVSGKAFVSRDLADLGNAGRVVGLATHYVYDLNGNVTAATDPQGNTRYTAYDERNRPVQQINPLAGDGQADAPIEVSPSEDTYVRSGIHANTQHGTADFLAVKHDNHINYHRVGVLEFELPAATVADIAALQYSPDEADFSLDLSLISAAAVAGTGETNTEQLVYLLNPNLIDASSVKWSDLFTSNTSGVGYPNDFTEYGKLLGSTVVTINTTGEISIDLGSSDAATKQALIDRIVDTGKVTLMITSPPDDQNRIYVKYATNENTTQGLSAPGLNVTLSGGAMQGVGYDPANGELNPGMLTDALDPYSVKTVYDDAGQVVRVTDEHGREYRTAYDAQGRVIAEVAPDADLANVGPDAENPDTPYLEAPVGGQVVRVGDTVTIPVNAVNPNGAPLSYEWTEAAGQDIDLLVHETNLAVPFDQTSDYTAYETGVTRTLVAGGGHDGGTALEITTNSSSGLKGGVYLYPADTGLEAGKFYRLSYWAKSVSLTPQSIELSHQNGQNSKSNLTHSQPLTTEWQKYERLVQLDVPRPTLYVSSLSSNYSFAIDDLKIEEVDPTRWAFTAPSGAVQLDLELTVSNDTGQSFVQAVPVTVLAAGSNEPTTAEAVERYGVDFRLHRTTRYAYDAAGNLVGTADAEGRPTYMYYDRLNRLTHTVNADADAAVLVDAERDDPFAAGYLVPDAAYAAALNDYAVKTDYDAAGQVVLVTDEMGRQYGTVYDKVGRVLADVAPHAVDDINAGRAFIAGADLFTGLSLAPTTLATNTDIVGRTTVYTYDAADQLLAATDPLGQTAWSFYDALGRLTHSVDERGDAWVDPNDDRLPGWAPGQSLPTGTLAHPEWAGDADADGHPDFTVVRTYDAVGRLITYADPNGNTTAYVYDDADRQTRMTDSLGLHDLYHFDSNGNLVYTIDRNGDQVLYRYDPLDRLVSEQWYGPAVGITPGVSGLYVADAPGVHEIAYEYNDDSRLRRVAQYDSTDPAAATLLDEILTTYDAASRVSREESINHAVDPANPFVTTFDLEYDQTDRLISVITGPDEVDGPLDAHLTSDPDGVPGVDDPTIYEYDNQGRIQFIRQGHDPEDWYTEILAKQIAYTYNASGQVENIEHAYGKFTTQPSIDYVNDFDTIFGYDTAGRLVSLQHKKPGENDTMGGFIFSETFAEYSYSLDVLDRIHSKDHYLQYDWHNDAVQDRRVRTFTYGYDPSGQMIASTVVSNAFPGASDPLYDNANNDESYNYDGAGNRDTQTLVTDTNRLSSDGTYSYTYDDAGRQTRRELDASNYETYAYDHRGRLTRVTTVVGGLLESVVDYQYDAWDRLVTRELVLASGEDNASAFAYLGDQRWVSATPADPASPRYDASDPWSRTLYLFAPGRETPFAADSEDRPYAGEWDGNNNNYEDDPFLWLLPDGAGTIRDVVGHVEGINNPFTYLNDPALHFDYSQFGEVLQVTDETGAAITPSDLDAWHAITGGLPFGFQGRAQDATTGLTHHAARWADPSTAKFLTEDPSGFAFGDPNLYRYLHNAPTVYADPTGLGNQAQAGAGHTILGGASPSMPGVNFSSQPTSLDLFNPTTTLFPGDGLPIGLDRSHQAALGFFTPPSLPESEARRDFDLRTLQAGLRNSPIWKWPSLGLNTLPTTGPLPADLEALVNTDFSGLDGSELRSAYRRLSLNATAYTYAAADPAFRTDRGFVNATLQARGQQFTVAADRAMQEMGGRGRPSFGANYAYMTGTDPVYSRLAGLTQMGGGTLELLGGVSIGWTPLGVPIMGHGVDTFVSGGRQMIFGGQQRTFTEIGVTHTAAYLGASDDTARQIGYWTDLGVGFTDVAGTAPALLRNLSRPIGDLPQIARLDHAGTSALTRIDERIGILDLRVTPAYNSTFGFPNMHVSLPGRTQLQVNSARGLSFQDDTLLSLGIAQPNYQIFPSQTLRGQPVNVQPDAITARTGILEIKDQRRIYRSRQIQGELVLAQSMNQPFSLVIGPNTRSVAVRLQDEIRDQGGIITRFNPQTRSFEVVNFSNPTFANRVDP